MSVINQMLQDLERRHAGPEERRALPDEIRPLPSGSDRRLVRRIGGWTLAVAGAGAVAWLVTAGRIEMPRVDTLAASRIAAAAPAPSSHLRRLRCPSRPCRLQHRRRLPFRPWPMRRCRRPPMRPQLPWPLPLA